MKGLKLMNMKNFKKKFIKILKNCKNAREKVILRGLKRHNNSNKRIFLGIPLNTWA